MTSHRRPAVDAAVAALGELMAERRRSSMAWVRACDLTMAQLHVLAILHESGAMTVGALAEALSISAPSVSAVVDRLEERGVAVRERSEDDRRTVHVSLTAEGRRFAEELHGLGTDVFRQVLAELSDADLGDMVRIAGLLREASARVAQRSRRAAAAS